MGRDLVTYLRCESAANDKLEGPSTSGMIEFHTFGSIDVPSNHLAVFKVTKIL